MDFSKMKRNKAAVLAALKKLPDKSVIALKDIRIVILQDYIRDNLIVLGESIRIIAQFAYVLDNNTYALSNAMGLIEITPDEITTTTIDDRVYNVYTFKAGSTVFPSTSIVKKGTIGYYCYNALISKGYVPRFYRVADKVQSFDAANRYAGIGIAWNRNIVGIHTALLARSPKDINKQFRYVVSSQEELDNGHPIFVGAKNVSAAIEGTVPAITGSYGNAALVGAIVNPTHNKTSIEVALTGEE